MAHEGFSRRNLGSLKGWLIRRCQDSNGLELVDLVPQFFNREFNRGDHKGKHDVFFQRGCDVLHIRCPDNLALAGRAAGDTGKVP